MQIHTLQLNTKRKKRKTIGRGGRKGSYSGRGIKGQKARSGASVDPLFEGGKSTLIDHMKKKKGFTSPVPKAVTVKLSMLEKVLGNGGTVNKETLIKAGVIRRKDFRRGIKILRSGEIKKKFIVEKGILLSRSAEQAIKNAGGAYNTSPVQSDTVTSGEKVASLSEKK